MLMKSFFSIFKNRYYLLLFFLSQRKIKKYNQELSISDINIIFKNSNDRYSYFHHYFYNLSPFWLKSHRKYFQKNKRAFGEDSFHAMWYLIFKEFRPINILEIGVYRGSTLSLFSLISSKLNIQSKIHGISPFTSANDSVSQYIDDIDYYSDVINNFNSLNINLPNLHVGFSTDVKMIEFINSNLWDLIFIDGNHDYEIVKSDFYNCSKNLKQGGIIVLDDSSLFTNYTPSFYSTAGHFGPSKVADEIDQTDFKEILSVGHNRIFLKL
jgi:hypothetical protein